MTKRNTEKVWQHMWISSSLPHGEPGVNVLWTACDQFVLGKEAQR